MVKIRMLAPMMTKLVQRTNAIIEKLLSLETTDSAGLAGST